LVESLYQAMMGHIPTLEFLLPSAHGACGHVLSCQTINVTASRNLGAYKNLSDSGSSRVE
jgi:hypothetical protein